MTTICRRHAVAALGAAGALVMLTAGAVAGPAPSTQRLLMRGQAQFLQLYGPHSGEPVVVSSGDGGWIHLAPHVAELLAARGFFVVGFDTKAYLAGFTTPVSTLHPADVPADFKLLADVAAAASGRKPILIGVSEGAGLSVLAGGDPAAKAVLAGVIAIGLTDTNELAWRWKDSLTYLTHRPPNEPMFLARSVVNAVAPLPLAMIQSTHDEFVPLDETKRIAAAAAEPKRLWIVDAADHRFSSNLPEFDKGLMEAIEWVRRSRAN
jgi:type IV secretory pathway VirJ component